MRIVDLNYHCHDASVDPETAWRDHHPAIGYADAFRPFGEVILIKHFRRVVKKVQHLNRISMPGSSSRVRRAFITNRLVATLNPDIIVVQGLIFPLEILMLSLVVSRPVRILVQHHGEQSRGPWLLLTRLANRRVDGFLFTAPSNAERWIRHGLIGSRMPIYPLLEASATLETVEQSVARLHTGIVGNANYLWVGRLNENKDPLTLIEGFGLLLKRQPKAKLYMIFQTEELLPAIEARLSSDTTLADAVTLVGPVPKNNMCFWYSSVRAYVSTSWREGSGYSLIEAIGYGCIPVVTDIPSFRMITDNYRMGKSFAPGNCAELARGLEAVLGFEETQTRRECREYFKGHLSFERIASDLAGICESLQV